MVVQNDDEAPTEVSTAIMKTVLDQNSLSYSEITKKRSKMTNRSKLTEKSDISTILKSKGHKKKSKETEEVSPSHSSTESEDNSSKTGISEKDLLELRTVYKKCKAVISKMEQKYGNLLEIDSSDTDGPSSKRSRFTEPQNDTSECQCTLNKKIVFDEEGKEETIDTVPDNHICPTKLMSKNYTVLMNQNMQNKNIEIEYYSKSIELSNDLQVLRRILKDTSIETAYRNQVIEKLKSIKLGYLNEIKFNKLSLIEKLKSNPDEVFHFNGSNLSVVTGYSY